MMEIAFEAAVQQLNAFLLPNFCHAEITLYQILHACQIRMVARELGLDQHEELTRLVCMFSDEAYAQQLFSLISEIAPVDEEQLFMNYYEGCDLELFPYEYGMNSLSYDQIYYLVENLDREDAEECLRVFTFFVCAYDELIGDFWDIANGEFGWGIENPEEPVNVDMDCLEEILNERGMAPFWGTMQVSGGASENAYLTGNRDLDAEVGNIAEGMEFSAENIRLLADEWEEAQEVLKAHNRAARMVEQDRSYLRRFYEAIMEAQYEQIRCRV